MSVLDKALSIIAPHNCMLCGDEGAVMCVSCGYSLPTLPSICYACGRATKNNQPCVDHKNKYVPERVFIHSEYKDEIKRLLYAYKFDFKRAAAIDIARLMADTLPYYNRPPLITYVPTIGKHMRERGFDHSKIIAKELAKLKNWHYAPLLYKNKAVMQKGKGRDERKRQLKNALEPRNVKLIKGASVLLVDDVVTTGATIEACANKLVKAGASEVDAVVLARTS